MPAPRQANTAAANAARRQIGINKAIEKLRAAGYTVVPPKGDNEPKEDQQ